MGISTIRLCDGQKNARPERKPYAQRVVDRVSSFAGTAESLCGYVGGSIAGWLGARALRLSFPMGYLRAVQRSDRRDG
jgi:hypothetical protein